MSGRVYFYRIKLHEFLKYASFSALLAVAEELHEGLIKLKNFGVLYGGEGKFCSHRAERHRD